MGRAIWRRRMGRRKGGEEIEQIRDRKRRRREKREGGRLRKREE